MVLKIIRNLNSILKLFSNYRSAGHKIAIPLRVLRTNLTKFEYPSSQETQQPNLH